MKNSVSILQILINIYFNKLNILEFLIFIQFTIKKAEKILVNLKLTIYCQHVHKDCNYVFSRVIIHRLWIYIYEYKLLLLYEVYWNKMETKNINVGKNDWNNPPAIVIYLETMPVNQIEKEKGEKFTLDVQII